MPNILQILTAFEGDINIMASEERTNVLFKVESNIFVPRLKTSSMFLENLSTIHIVTHKKEIKLNSKRDFKQIHVIVSGQYCIS